MGGLDNMNLLLPQYSTECADAYKRYLPSMACWI